MPAQIGMFTVFFSSTENSIGPHPERADETAISGSLRLHPLRHPFARRRPSPDSFGMNRAISAHLHPLLRGLDA